MDTTPLPSRETLETKHRASRWLRGLALGALLALAVAGSWNHGLLAYDEPREAELARAMFRSSDWAVMSLGERPFLDKPPLYCESVAVAFRALGRPSALAARLVTALWALGTLAATAWLARRLLGAGAGLPAALVLATTWRFYSISHEVLLDNALAAFTTASIGAGAIAARTRDRRLAVLAAAALAGAFLTKGLVGVGIAGLVLLLDLIVRRDREGLRVLLDPRAFAAFLAPVALYLVALVHAAGPSSRSFLYEIFWANQLGRFLGSHGQKASRWYLYLKQWPEMLAVWAPAALLALGDGVQTWRQRRAVSAARRDAVRFLLLWAVAPLVVLSFSKGRARPYALPVVPAYALLVVAWWRGIQEKASSPWVSRLATLWVLGGALAVAGSVAAIALLARDRLDLFELSGALLALGCAAVWLARGRDPERARGDDATLLLGLVVLSGFLVASGALVAARWERSQGYRAIAEEVDAQVRGRRLDLFHVSNSYSGAFAFYSDRTTPEFDAGFDPDGSRLLAAIGPIESEVVLAPSGALGCFPEERRRELAVIWSGTREADADSPRKRFVLFGRRR